MIEMMAEWFHWLIGYIHQFTGVLSKGDPVVNGLATMAVLSFLMFTMRRVPLKLVKLLVGRITYQYTLTMTNNHGADKEYFEKLAEVVRLHNTKRRIFNLSFLGTQSGRELAITSGKGTGYFFLGKGIVFFTRTEIVGKDLVEFSFVFRTLLVSQNEFRRFVDIDPQVGKSLIYIPSAYSGESPMVSRALNTDSRFNIHPRIKRQIDEALLSQQEQMVLFRSRAVNTKLNFLFYGPPGTGKSSLTLYIANQTKRSIYIPDALFKLFQASTEAFVNRVKPIIILDDLERERELTAKIPDDGSGSDISMMRSLINYLDGVQTVDDRIVVITSNDPTKLPQALYRNNRIDVMIHVDYDTIEDFPRCLAFYFPDSDPAQYDLPHNLLFSQAICANMFKKHYHSPDAWVAGVLAESVELNASAQHTPLLKVA